MPRQALIRAAGAKRVSRGPKALRGVSQGATPLWREARAAPLPYPVQRHKHLTRAKRRQGTCPPSREMGVERAEGPSWGSGAKPLTGCKGRALARSPEGSALWRGGGAAPLLGFRGEAPGRAQRETSPSKGRLGIVGSACPLPVPMPPHVCACGGGRFSRGGKLGLD